jgi:hypothetical protein
MADLSMLQAAQGAGMLSIAVPSSFSGRGTFSGADAVMDSFGAGTPLDGTQNFPVNSALHKQIKWAHGNSD